MKGCLDSIFIILLGIAGAAYLVWLAYQNPDPVPKAIPVEDDSPSSIQRADAPSVQRELDGLKRQFQSTTDYQQRLSSQHLTESTLRSRIEKTLTEQQHIEHTLPHASEEQARQWYESHHESLRIPESYHAAHIFLTRHVKTKPDREAEIRAIHRQITAGSISFSGAAAKFSEDDRSKQLAGDLGWFTHERMPPDLVGAVRNLRPGQISAPQLTELGWHIFQLIEKRPSRLPSFEECRAEILARIETQIRESALQRKNRS